MPRDVMVRNKWPHSPAMGSSAAAACPEGSSSIPPVGQGGGGSEHFALLTTKFINKFNILFAFGVRVSPWGADPLEGQRGLLGDGQASALKNVHGPHYLTFSLPINLNTLNYYIFW